MKGIAFYGSDFFTIKQDIDLYAEGLQRLLMTNPGERPGQPYFGVGLRGVLFELADETTAEEVKNRIYEQTSIYMPMVDITRIETNIENNSFFVRVGFVEKGELPEDERILTLEFENVEGTE